MSRSLYPRQKSNLVRDFRKIACYPSQPEDISEYKPDSEHPLSFELRTILYKRIILPTKLRVQSSLR